MKKRDFLKLVFKTASLFFFSTIPSFSNSHKKKGKGKNKSNKGDKKKREYFINNIYPNLKIESPLHQKIEGFVQPNTIPLEIYKMAGIMPGPLYLKIQKYKKNVECLILV